MNNKPSPKSRQQNTAHKLVPINVTMHVTPAVAKQFSAAIATPGSGGSGNIVATALGEWLSKCALKQADSAPVHPEIVGGDLTINMSFHLRYALERATESSIITPAEYVAEVLAVHLYDADFSGDVPPPEYTLTQDRCEERAKEFQATFNQV